MEEATRELLKLQAKLEEKLAEQVGQARPNNIRIDGIEEESGNNSTSLMVFVENPLNSIVVKFSRSKPTEDKNKNLF